MSDLGIIFCHFTMDEATHVNLESFRRWHTDGPILTVSASDVGFEGGFFVKDFPLWDPTSPWRNADFLFYHGYRSRPVNCRRWLYVEWDCYCNMLPRDFLRHVWDFDFASPSVRLMHREGEWHWFREIPLLPEEFRPYAMGVVPLNGTMVSDQALGKIVDVVLRERLPVFCELRIATASNRLGFAPVANPLGNTLTWTKAWTPQEDLPPGLWHPIKFAMKPGNPKS